VFERDLELHKHLFKQAFSTNHSHKTELQNEQQPAKIWLLSTHTTTSTKSVAKED